MLTRQARGRIVLSWILMSKTVCTASLIGIEVTHLVLAYEKEQLVYFLTPFILIMTYVIET